MSEDSKQKKNNSRMMSIILVAIITGIYLLMLLIVTLNFSVSQTVKFYMETIGVTLILILVSFWLVDFIFKRIFEENRQIGIYKLLSIVIVSVIIVYLTGGVARYKDIPYILDGKNSYIKGELSNFRITEGRTTNATFNVNGIKFNIGYNDFREVLDLKGVVDKSEYIITYLTNSKFVINIKKAP